MKINKKNDEVKTQVMKLDAEVKAQGMKLEAEMREIKGLLASIASKTK